MFTVEGGFLPILAFLEQISKSFAANIDKMFKRPFFTPYFRIPKQQSAAVTLSTIAAAADGFFSAVIVNFLPQSRHVCVSIVR